MPWSVTVTIVKQSLGPNALVESNYGQSGYLGNFEVITVPTSNPTVSYQHFYQINVAIGPPWYSGPMTIGYYEDPQKPTQQASESQIKEIFPLCLVLSLFVHHLLDSSPDLYCSQTYMQTGSKKGCKSDY